MRIVPPAALAVLPLVLATLAPGAAAQDWSNLGGGPGRNGLSAATGPAAATLLWTDISNPAVISWAPFTEGERVFTVRESGFPSTGGAANDELVGYALADGAELWSETLPYGGDPNVEWIAWIGGVEDGRVFASRASHQKPGPIHALDAATGALLWTSLDTCETFAYDGVVFAPDGDPIVGDWQRILRLEASTGATVWSISRNRAVSGNCGAAITATAVFIDEVAVGGQVVTKLDLATGARLYSSPVMPGFTAQNSPFLSPDGATVYFARTQNNPGVDALYAFTDTGAALVPKWNRPVRWTTSHEHGIGADGSIYTFLAGNEFVRLDPATGHVTASAGVLAPIGASNLSPSTAIGADGTVYVSNGWASSPASDGRLWAFSADLATEHFVIQLDRQNQGGPALAHDGTLIVCDRVGVHAYREAGAQAFCSGDGSGTACPCGNAGDALHGCANGSFASGCALAGAGQASVGADSFTLVSTRATPGQPGLYFQGDVAVNGGDGTVFGDGLRCAGVNVVRLQTLAADGNGDAATTVAIAALAGVSPGETCRYQLWYRDPTLSPCGTGFNLSNGVEVTWGP